jgi:hypothetical protein
MFAVWRLEGAALGSFFMVRHPNSKPANRQASFFASSHDAFPTVPTEQGGDVQQFYENSLPNLTLPTDFATAMEKDW